MNVITRLNLKQAPRLAKGQIWKLKHMYIQIVDLGRKLLNYRMLNSLDETGVREQKSEVDVMWRYLQSRGARLVRQDTVRAA